MEVLWNTQQVLLNIFTEEPTEASSRKARLKAAAEMNNLSWGGFLWFYAAKGY